LKAVLRLQGFGAWASEPCNVVLLLFLQVKRDLFRIGRNDAAEGAQDGDQTIYSGGGSQIINLKHELVLLAGKIEGRSTLERVFALPLSRSARSGASMAGAMSHRSHAAEYLYLE
jgi:hypothetical protein